jgi:hypothetical protein
MNYQSPHATLIEKLCSMGVKENSKYSLEEILNRQDPDLISGKYLLAFHKGLTELLDKVGLPWECRTNDRGLTYFSEGRAFIMLSINNSFISILFFTGKLDIKGLEKANWSTGSDNSGCVRFKVSDDHSLRLAIKFGLLSYFIADNWLDCPEHSK